MKKFVITLAVALLASAMIFANGAKEVGGVVSTDGSTSMEKVIGFYAVECGNILGLGGVSL